MFKGKVVKHTDIYIYMLKAETIQGISKSLLFKGWLMNAGPNASKPYLLYHELYLREATLVFRSV